MFYSRNETLFYLFRSNKKLPHSLVICSSIDDALPCSAGAGDKSHESVLVAGSSNGGSSNGDAGERDNDVDDQHTAGGRDDGLECRVVSSMTQVR